MAETYRNSLVDAKKVFELKVYCKIIEIHVRSDSLLW